MIEAKSGCGLGWYRLAVLCDEMPVGEFQRQPVWRRVDVRLHDYLQAYILSKFQHQVELFEVVFVLARLSGSPFDPRAYCVEPERFDLLQIFAPLRRRTRSDGVQHRRARFASGVPDGNWEKAIGGRRGEGDGRQNQQDPESCAQP